MSTWLHFNCVTRPYQWSGNLMEGAQSGSILTWNRDLCSLDFECMLLSVEHQILYITELNGHESKGMLKSFTLKLLKLNYGSSSSKKGNQTKRSSVNKRSGFQARNSTIKINNASPERYGFCYLGSLSHLTKNQEPMSK